MPRLYVLATNDATTTTTTTTTTMTMMMMVMMTTTSIVVPSNASGGRAIQIERPSVIQTENVVSPENRNAMFQSPSFLFLHLLKHKPQYTKLEKISTTTPASMRDCLCVPFYLCDSNQTIITDGTGIIDVRIRRCMGDLEVCCYLPNNPTNPSVTPTAPTTMRPTMPPTIPPITIPPITITPMTRPTVTPTVLPTSPSTMPPTIPPITLPTTSPTTSPTTLPPVVFPTSMSPPVTGLPNVNCICVETSLCDPNGIVTISGEGVISPRQQPRLCPSANQVCCRILATSSAQPPTTMAVSTFLPPGQICFVCGNIIQCVICRNIGTPGTIDPRLPSSREGLCSANTNLLSCQGATLSPDADALSPVMDLLGPLKNPGTPRACYCVKTWLCSEGNAISPDGLGVIDSRFTTCPSADQVCCRAMGIDLQTLRSADIMISSSSESFIVNVPFDTSLPQVTCGIRSNSYAPSQSFPADSNRTYFAEFPWMVALLVKSASGPYVFQCGASMINHRVVLTAAHCVINRQPEDLVARFGQWNIGNDAQPLPIQQANILAVATHPLYYSGGLFHDIALLVLDKPVVYSVNVMPICLPEQSMIFAAGIRCYGIGWGRSSFGSKGTYQAELRKVDLPIVDRADCQMRLRSTKLGQYFQLHGSFICAGGEANRDTCSGDGGGPLACQASTGQFFQAGIVSWGIGCGTTNIPAVYASVSQHRQWIDQQLATYGVQ